MSVKWHLWTTLRTGWKFKEVFYRWTFFFSLLMSFYVPGVRALWFAPPSMFMFKYDPKLAHLKKQYVQTSNMHGSHSHLSSLHVIIKTVNPNIQSIFSYGKIRTRPTRKPKLRFIFHAVVAMFNSMERLHLVKYRKGETQSSKQSF